MVGVAATLVTLVVWTYENKHLFDLVVSKFKNSS